MASFVAWPHMRGNRKAGWNKRTKIERRCADVRNPYRAWWQTNYRQIIGGRIFQYLAGDAFLPTFKCRRGECDARSLSRKALRTEYGVPREPSDELSHRNNHRRRGGARWCALGDGVTTRRVSRVLAEVGWHLGFRARGFMNRLAKQAGGAVRQISARQEVRDIPTPVHGRLAVVCAMRAADGSDSHFRNEEEARPVRGHAEKWSGVAAGYGGCLVRSGVGGCHGILPGWTCRRARGIIAREPMTRSSGRPLSL